MSDTVVQVENLGKKYIIGHQNQGSFPTLRDRITEGAGYLKRKLFSAVSGKSIPDPTHEEFWALKDVSFEVKQGDRIGIIGRNGAGKSTLLKLLSRITEPSTGKMTIRGRVASLLEVGTGFHPELTGRENIYLNGSVLGMGRVEIKRKFDEIVAFSEVERFLDTPVKRYSSGMYVRLAFAVAAHLEPEILIVDEVLAVGDIAFQKKCLGKLEEVGKEGRTVLFVSHDLKNISGLCSSAFLLDRGCLIKTGKTSDVIRFYGELIGSKQDEIYRVVSKKMTWKGISNQHCLENLSHADDLRFIFNFETGDEDILNFHLDCGIYNEKDECVIHTMSKFISDGFTARKNEKFSISYLVKHPNLAPGSYYMTIYVYTDKYGYEELIWIEKVRGCFVSSISNFPNSQILDEITSATVPNFDMRFERASPSEVNQI